MSTHTMNNVVRLAWLTALMVVLSSSTVGIANAAPTATWWSLPLIAWNYSPIHWYSTVTVFNGSGKYGWGHVDVRTPSGMSACSPKEQIAPYSTAKFFLKDACTLPADSLYSATAWVDVNGDIVPSLVSSIVYSDDNRTMEYTGQPNSLASSVSYAAGLMRGYHGWDTALTVHNMADSAANITVEIAANNTTYTLHAYGLAKYASYVFYSELPTSSLPYSAKVTSDKGNVSSLVTVFRDAYHRASAHIGTTNVGPNVTFPRLVSTYYDTNSAVTCMNATASPINMALSIHGATDTRYDIPPGGTYTWYLPSSGVVAPGFNGPGSMNASGKVACVVTGDDDQNTSALDYAWAYNPQDANSMAYTAGGDYHQSIDLGIITCCSNSNDSDSGIPGADGRWFWNYDYRRDGEGNNDGSNGSTINTDFVPALWGGACLPQSQPYEPHPDCADRYPASIDPSEFVMGTNEPNRKGQGNTCARDYKPWWDAIKNRFSDNGRKLVSPGVADIGEPMICRDGGTDTADGVQWLTNLMDQYGAHNEAGIDVLNTHCYGSTAYCSGYLERVHALAANRGVPEVWLTEFNPVTTELEFREMMKYIARTPWITRFSMYPMKAYGGFSQGLFDVNMQPTNWSAAYWMYR